MRALFLGTALRTVAVGVVGLGIAASAVATPLSNPVLDPSNTLFPASGAFNEQVCPTPQSCPSNGGSISGNAVVTFSIANVDGIGNIVIIGNTTPSTGGTFSFAYTLTDLTTSTVVSTGLPQSPPDFDVIAGDDYQISLMWTLTAGVGRTIRSADYTLTVTTGPAAAVPEPATLALLGSALIGFGVSRRRKQR